MGSPFLEAGVTSAFLIISGNVLVLIQLLKKNFFFFHNRQKKIPRVLILERHLTFFISRKFLHEI